MERERRGTESRKVTNNRLIDLGEAGKEETRKGGKENWDLDLRPAKMVNMHMNRPTGQVNNCFMSI